MEEPRAAGVRKNDRNTPDNGPARVEAFLVIQAFSTPENTATNARKHILHDVVTPKEPIAVRNVGRRGT